jgi:uncharacterized membrane protein YcaP (DUF421 family)
MAKASPQMKGNHMLNDLWNDVESLLGIGSNELATSEIALRAAVTFAVTVFFLRLGDKRLLGKGTVFDTVVAIMIGSVMAGSITSPPLFKTWLAGLVLIGMHRLLAWLSSRVDWFGPVIKGNRVALIKNGEIDEQGMTEGNLTRRELDQAIRESGNHPDPSQIKLAVLERDGSISIVPKSSEPRILDVSVENGVQTVRVAME